MLSLGIIVIVFGSDNHGDVVGTLADTIAATLRSGTEALESSTAVYEDGVDEELAVFGFTLVFLFPVGNCGADEFLQTRCCFLIRELKNAEGTEHFLSAYHVGYQTHFAGAGGDVQKLS
jgi:hypothetical protein